MFLDSEVVHKEDLASFFQQCFPKFPQPCLVQASHDNGPRSCSKVFAEKLGGEQEEVKELGKRRVQKRFNLPEQVKERQPPAEEEKEESEEDCLQRLIDHIFIDHTKARIILLSKDLIDVFKVQMADEKDVLFVYYSFVNGNYIIGNVVSPAQFVNPAQVLVKPNFRPQQAGATGGLSTPKVGADSTRQALPRPSFSTQGPLRPEAPQAKPAPPPFGSQPPKLQTPVLQPAKPPQFPVPKFLPSKLQAANPGTPTPMLQPQKPAQPATQAPANQQATPSGTGPKSGSSTLTQSKFGNHPPPPQKAGPPPSSNQSKAAPNSKIGPAQFLAQSSSQSPVSNPESGVQPKFGAPKKREEEAKSVSTGSTSAAGIPDPGSFKSVSATGSKSAQPTARPPNVQPAVSLMNAHPHSGLKELNLKHVEELMPDLAKAVAEYINDAFKKLSQRAPPSQDSIKDTLMREVQQVLSDYHSKHVEQVHTLQQEVDSLFKRTNEAYREEITRLEQTLGEVTSTQRAVSEAVSELASQTEGGITLQLRRNGELLETLNQKSTGIYNYLPDLVKKTKRHLISFDSLRYDEAAHNLTYSFTNRKLYPIQGESLCFCIADEGDWKYDYPGEIAPGQHERAVNQMTQPQGVICCYLGEEMIGESRIEFNSQGELVFVNCLPAVIVERNRERAELIKQEMGAELTEEMVQYLDQMVTRENFDIMDSEEIKAELRGS